MGVPRCNICNDPSRTCHTYVYVCLERTSNDGSMVNKNKYVAAVCDSCVPKVEWILKTFHIIEATV